MTFKIEKRANGSFWHYINDVRISNISDFDCVYDQTYQTFIIQCKNGSNVPQKAVKINDVILNISGVNEYFGNVATLESRLRAINYTPYTSSGSGGIAVNSVNGLDGDVVLNGSNILATNPSTLAQEPIDDILEALGGNVIVEADITDLDKYTQSEVDNLLDNKEDKVSGVKAFGSDNYTATVPDVTELVFGYKTVLSFENPNTGASTLNLNGLGVFEIVKEDNVQLVGNDLLGTHFVMWNGTKWQLVGNAPIPTPFITDEIEAIQSANTPSSTNPFATIDDLEVLDADDIAETATRKWQSANQDNFNDATSSIQTQLDSKLAKTLFNYTSMLTPIRGNSGLTIIGYSGATSPSIGNTARGGDGLSKFTNMNRLGYVTTAVAGYVASFRQTTDVAHSSYPFEVLFSFGKGVSVANQRSGYGFFNNPNIPTNVEATTLLNCFGICELSTSNNWHIFHNDNAGLATTIDLGVNFPCKNTNTDIINFYMKNIVGTGIYYEVECNGNISSGTITTDLPTSTSLWYKWWTTNNTTASSCSIEIFKFTLNLNLQ